MGIEQFLVDRNIARNKKQAEGLMIGVIVLCLIFIGIRMFGGKSSGRDLSPEELQQLEAEFGADFEGGFSGNDPATGLPQEL